MAVPAPPERPPVRPPVPAPQKRYAVPAPPQRPPVSAPRKRLAMPAPPERPPVPVPRMRLAVPAPPERPPVPAPRQRYAVPASPGPVPPVSALPERPQVPVPPECLQVPDRAPTFPKEIWGGGSRAPAEEAGAGAGADPPWPPKSSPVCYLPLDTPTFPRSFSPPFLSFSWQPAKDPASVTTAKNPQTVILCAYLTCYQLPRSHPAY